MITFSAIRDRLASIWSHVSPAVVAAENLLQTLLTPEHIAQGEATVVAVKDALHPTSGAKLTGFQKAEAVGDVLRTLPLSDEATQALGAIVGALHLVATAKGLLK